MFVFCVCSRWMAKHAKRQKDGAHANLYPSFKLVGLPLVFNGIVRESGAPLHVAWSTQVVDILK